MSRLKRDENELPATGRTEANGTGHSLFDEDALAPAGVTTSTIAKWLKVRDDGVTYFIPMWT